jgi:hypothetical protein
MHYSLLPFVLAPCYRLGRASVLVLPLAMGVGACDDPNIEGDLASEKNGELAPSELADDADTAEVGDPPGPTPAGPTEIAGPLREQRACHYTPAPAVERAWKINQKGYLDTNIDFSSFFGGPHTVMGWVMPEFTYNYSGPIFAENGSGTYLVGQGNYRDGNFVLNEDEIIAGDPVLNVSLGGKQVNYLAPGYVKRQWNHIALVRTAADGNGKFTFKLYVNGVLLAPIGGVEISFSPADPMIPSEVPQGKLRLGRRTSGLNLDSSKSWQFYGLIDEVAVFDSALSQADISQLMQCGFGGDELAMVAGMTFDAYGFQTPPGPKIVSPVTPVAPVSSFVQRLTVASGAKSANAGDAALFEGPHVAPTQGSYQLPFPAGEVWQVQQAPDTAGGTHNGFAAFSWDFKRVVAPMQGTVSAAATGQIYYVKEGVVLGNNEAEANAVRINVAPNESVLYLHLEPFSFTDIFMDGNLFFAPQTGPQYYLPVTQGAELAKSGMNAAHLHFDGNDGAIGVNSGGVTMPIGFSNYEVFDPNVQQWIPVLRGMPKGGEIIRRM